jgi:hypothetical protein
MGTYYADSPRMQGFADEVEAVIAANPQTEAWQLHDPERDSSDAPRLWDRRGWHWNEDR